MRQPSSVLRYLVLLSALCFAARAHADDRAEAQTHYQAGVTFYTGGDYRSAIREFSAAQQLAPADLNNYNLALCYDRLGDTEPAIQYYRAFLDKQPGTDKRSEIEANINRLEAASQSAASKKADEAKRAAGPPPGPVPGPAVGPSAGPAPAPSPGAPGVEPRRKTGPAVAGSIGTPSSAAPTGDPQLDRANAINIDELRDQRLGGAGGGAAAHRGGPAVAANEAAQPGGPAPAASGAGAAGVSGQPVPSVDQPRTEAPFYKHWWFWPIAGVVVFVVYEFATSSSSSPSNSGRQLPANGHASAQPGGLTLLRW